MYKFFLSIFQFTHNKLFLFQVRKWISTVMEGAVVGVMLLAPEVGVIHPATTMTTPVTTRACTRVLREGLKVLLMLNRKGIDLIGNLDR